MDVGTLGGHVLADSRAPPLTPGSGVLAASIPPCCSDHPPISTGSHFLGHGC